MPLLSPRSTRRLFAIVISALFLVSATSTAGALTRGRVDGKLFERFADGGEDVRISLDGPVLNAAISRGDEGGVEMRVDALEVRALHFERADLAAVEDEARALRRELMDEGWSPLVTVSSREEHVDVLVLGTLDEASPLSVDGLVVLVVDGDGREFIFVNMAGRFSLDHVGGIAESLDLPDEARLDRVGG